MQTPTDLTRYLLNQFESISAKAVKRVGSEIATLTTNLIKGTGAKLVAIVDDVSGAIKRFIHVGGGGGGGGSFSQPVSAAPAGGSNNDLRAVADVTVPVGAAFLTFDLSVLDAGNSDVLEIALGDDLVGEIDLRTQQAAADTAVQLYVGRYAGRATTLTFLTPSDVPTTAEYTIGNINFNVLDPDTTAPHGRVFGTDDGKGMASGDSLMIAFDEPVHVLDPSGLSLSRDGGPNLLTSAQTLSSDDQKVWILRGLGGLALADGNYVFRINAAAVRDLSDNPIDGDADGVAGGDLTLSFFRLAGDANRDRTVNFADLLALARNYNKTGATWADGDFDGNGIVNFNDLLTLARNYNKTLPAAGAAPAPAAAMDLGALAAAMGIAVPTTSPTKPTPPPAAAKKPPVSPKPAPKPTPVVRAVTPAPVAAKSPAASVLRDDDKAKPVFSTTRVVKPAPAKPKVVARAKGR